MDNEKVNTLDYNSNIDKTTNNLEELKKIGGVKPPREFVLMDRAAVGLGSVFMHLKAEINWHQLFHGLIDDFTLDSLEKRQKSAIKQIGLPESLIAK